MGHRSLVALLDEKTGYLEVEIMKVYKVAVIGGGAAGLVAAGRCAKKGTPTLLLEKNKYLGRKIGITARQVQPNSRIASIEDIIAQYRKRVLSHSAFFSF